MPSNTTLNTNATSGDKIVTKQVTHDGDTAKLQIVGLALITGTEDAYTQTDISASNPLPISDAGGSLTVDDGGGSLTVDGTVTVSDGGGSLTIDNAALSVVGGGAEAAALRVTLANDSTGVLSVDDNGSSLTVDGTVAATQSGTWSTRTQDGAGNALTSKAAGAERALSIAVVDGSGNQVTSFGGGTQYAEDAASAGGESLTLAGFVRQDTPAGSTSADGDYAYGKTDSLGRLWVNASGAAVPITDNSGSLTVDNAGTFAVQESGGALTALQLIDDAIVADDAAFTPATTKVMMAGFEFDDATPDSVNEGDAGAARMSANRNIYVQVRDAAGNERGLNIDASGFLGVTDGGGTLTVDNAALAVTGGGVEASALRVTLASDSTGVLSVDDNGGSLTVDGTVAVSSITTSVTPGTAAANLGKAEDAPHASSDVGVMALAVQQSANASFVGTDGDYAPLQLDANGALKVNIVAGAGSGGTASTDDAAFTAASGSGTPMMGFVTSDSVDTGDVGVVGMLANRQLKVTLYDSAGAELSVGGGTQYTEDAAATANPIGNAIIVVRDDARTGSLTTADGDNVALRGTNAGELYVKHVDAIPVTDNGTTLSIDDGAGSITVDGTVAISSLPASTNTLEVVGDAAHDAVAAGNPVLMGGYASAAAPTAVSADGDAVRLWATTSGALNVADGGGSLTIDGTVAVSAVTAGTSATHLGKAIDSAAGSTDTGVAILAVRDDALSTLTPVEGDYVPLRTSSTGALWVNVTNGVQGVAEDTAAAGGEDGLPILVVRRDSASSGVSADGDWANLSVDSTGALRVTGGGGGTQYSIDSTAGATDTGTLALLVRDDALATLTPVDGDYTQGRTNARGALWVALDSTAAQTVTLAAGTATNEVVGDAAHDAAVAGNPLLVGAYASAAAPTAVSADGDAVRLWADLNGRLQIGDGGGSITVDGAVAVTNAGTFATQVDGAALTALQLIDDTIIADDAAFTVGTTKVNMAGFTADETSTDSVDDGDAGAARMTLDRKQIVAGYAHTAGGWTPSHTVSAASTNGTSLKASAGQVGVVTVSNVNAAMRYLKLYNKASAPTVGTDTPVFVIPIPGNAAGAGCVVNFGSGLEFITGIAWALTTGAANADTGAVAASEIIVGIAYK